MQDKNGNQIGVLSHLAKTHVTDNDNINSISSLNKNLGDIKINDQLSNEEILSYTYPKETTNKQNLLLDAINAKSDGEKYHTLESEKGQIDISSRTNTSNTGLED
ncbi:MAG: hypothetical protein K5986_02820 [Clostridium sp.]|uniref:hypothetical protein n=1 Tax=Clostridium sp. DSM 8431 TaxID=1761781 RepID=UPI0008DEB93F|nr:hypothetical protein [Clostridium sp. DSM 8431]MCR4943389.1 hypothetical protein [Clostridium sp.]SFU37484.1 hypothetical protein SAMN04487886_101425 [Clostridium sp. DSM 8431]